MATSSSMMSMKDWSHMHILSAIAGLVFTMASAVQFLDATVAVGVFSLTLKPGLAMLVSLGALVVAFASSDTRDWDYYATEEQAVIGIAIFAMLAANHMSEFQTFLSSNQPVSGIGAFLISLTAWLIISQ